MSDAAVAKIEFHSHIQEGYSRHSFNNSQAANVKEMKDFPVIGEVIYVEYIKDEAVDYTNDENDISKNTSLKSTKHVSF